MSKANKKVNIDAMLSSDEESVEQPKKVVKGAAATTKPAAKKAPAKKDSDDESSSEEEITILKNKTKRDTEEVKGKQAVSANAKTVAKTVKKPVEPSDSDEESSEEVKPVKKAVAATKAPAKKQESSDDESSEEAKPVKKAVPQTKPATKAPAKKQESSDEESSEDEKPQAKKPVTKAPAKKESSDEEESDDEPVAKPQAKTNGNGHTSTSNSGCMELFVKNLGWKTDENTLGNFFGNYGEVQSVKILYDRETGRSKGLAFVGFASRDQAQAALNDAANLNVDGRLLTVSFSDEKPQRDGNQGGFGGNRGGNQGGYGGNQGGYGGNQGGNRGGNYGGEKHTVFVGNLGFKSNENGIKNFFRDCGNVVDVRIAKNEEGRSKGFCHVDFDSVEAVEKAKGKAGQELDGRELRVDASTPRQGGGSRGGFGGRGGRGGGRGGRGGNMNPMDRAKKTGAMISNPGAVKTFDDDDD